MLREVQTHRERGRPGRRVGNMPGGPKGGRVPAERGHSPGRSDRESFLSSVTSYAITLQCLKGLKEKLQFKRKTLDALFAYECLCS